MEKFTAIVARPLQNQEGFELAIWGNEHAETDDWACGKNRRLAGATDCERAWEPRFNRTTGRYRNSIHYASDSSNYTQTLAILEGFLYRNNSCIAKETINGYIRIIYHYKTHHLLPRLLLITYHSANYSLLIAFQKNHNFLKNR